MNFESPYLLWMLFLPGIMGGIHAWKSRSSLEKKRFPWLLLGTGFLILSLAKPYWNMIPSRKIIKSVDLIIIADVSQSMFCQSPGEPRRIDQARIFLKNLLPQFAGSQISVVYFAGDARVGCPFTSDQQAIYLFIDSITPAMSLTPGTNSGSLEKTLEELLAGRRASSVSDATRPVALFLSDGEFFDRPGILQAWAKRHSELRFFLFPCGSGKNPVPKYDLSGPFPNAFSQVRTETLQALAKASDGIVFDLGKSTDKVTKEVLRKVGDFIAQGESVPEYRPEIFLLLSLICIALHQFYPFLISSSGTVIPATAIAILLVVTVSMKPSSRDDLFKEALQDTKQRKYENALKELQQLQKEFPAEEVLVALGNVYFQQQKYDQAIRYYQEALQKNSGNRAARWNWEVTLKRKSSPEQPPPKETPRPAPQQLPDQTRSLLKYFDQLEKEQMQERNKQNANTSNFAW